MVAALSAAARLGILVKNVTDLEAAGRINAAIFDKTGTLTTGNLGVSRLAPHEGVSPTELLRTAAGTAQFSNHPAAQAMVTLAGETGIELPTAEHIHEEAGQGMRGTVDGQPVLIGRATWLQENGVPAEQFGAEDLAETEGLSVSCVARGGTLLGWVGLQDQVREEAKGCVDALRDLNVKRLAMVTGDRKAVAEKVAATIGVSEFRAECLPEGKVDFVNSVRADGYRVAVVGDGVNDAPALAAGDTGIAMGAAGSDAAIHSASVALMNNDLRRLPFLIRLSREARAVIHQNLGVGILFIVGGLYMSVIGELNPIVAAILHNAGSLIVVFNSARLIRSGEELEHELPADEAAAEPVAPAALESA
jgi:Cd2+/Zn2+-exporting ATPase